MRALFVRAIAALALLAAAYLVATTLAAIVANNQPFPYNDQWASVGDARAAAEARFGFLDLFRQHNEHRIALPRLVFFADARLCSERGWFALACSVVAQALHAWLLVAILRRGGVRRPLSIACGATLIGYQFAAAQLQNLIEPFQVQFVLVFAFATAAFAALSRAADPAVRGRFTLLAILAALGSTLSMANGLLVWPLLLGMALRLRLGRGSIAAMTLCAAVVFAGYLRGYATPGYHSSPLESLQEPLLVGRYLANYLASTLRWSDWHMQPLWGPIVVGVGIVPFGAGIVRTIRAAGSVGIERDSETGARLAAAAVGLFAIGTAGMTALGRLRFPLEQAWSPRYGTPALLFWSAALILAATTLGPRLRTIGLGLGALVLVSLVVQQASAIAVDASLRTKLRRLGTGMEAGVQDPRAMANHGEPDVVYARLATFMRERRLSVFADDRWRAVGRPLVEVAGSEPLGRCRGSIDEIRDVPDSGWGFTVSGWAWIEGEACAAARGFVVDAHGTVVGLVDFDAERPDVAKVIAATAGRRIGYHGYGSVAADAGALALVVADVAGHYHSCETGRTFAGELVAGPGSAIAGIDFKYRGAVEPIASQYLQPPPLGGPGALRTTAAGIGEARLGPITGVGSVIVPLLTGESAFGTSVQIVDRSDGKVVRRLWPATTFGGWRYWRVQLPADGAERAYDVVLQDAGTLAGEYACIGMPTSGDLPSK